MVCGCGKYLSTELESAARTIHNYYSLYTTIQDNIYTQGYIANQLPRPFGLEL